MIKKTCLYDSHIALGAKMVDFAGFDMPIQYEGILQEHKAVRTAIGLFDVSHMGKIKVIGPGSLKYLQELLTNDISGMTENQAIYSPMCYPNGTTVDDILVYKLADEDYLLVVNASNKDKDYEWLVKNKEESMPDLIDITDRICQVAVQGPKAVELIKSLTSEDVDQIPYYHFMKDVIILDTPMLVSRTGYTGEDGYELYFDEKEAARIWKALLELGQSYGIKPCGLGARDTLRFEAGMPLYGNELSETINPLEVGLSMFVKLDKVSFIGKDALTAYKNSPKRKLIGFELIDKGIARHGDMVIDAAGETIGLVTTGYMSPTYNVTIGTALVPYDYNHSEVSLQVRKKTLSAKVVLRRFKKVYNI